MNPIKEAYQNVERFVDSFANSEAGKQAGNIIPVNAPAWYAAWDDNYLGKALDNAVVRAILRRIADNYYGSQLEELLGQASELTEKSHPVLYGVYAQCCKVLRMYNMPRVYITGRFPGVNALSMEVNGRKIILISRLAAMELSPSELSFMLGHELGHHQQGNLVCHTVNGLLDSINDKSEIVGPLISDAVAVPLKRWCRCSEFNADRAGYLCCNDIEVVQQLFVKLGMDRASSAYSRLKEIDSDHPLLSTRLERVLEYAKNNEVT